LFQYPTPSASPDDGDTPQSAFLHGAQDDTPNIALLSIASRRFDPKQSQERAVLKCLVALGSTQGLHRGSACGFRIQAFGKIAQGVVAKPSAYANGRRTTKLSRA
jgi:hypothetical protein